MSWVVAAVSFFGQFLMFLGILSYIMGGSAAVAGVGAFTILMSEGSMLLRAAGKTEKRLLEDMPASFLKMFGSPILWTLFFLITESILILAIAIPSAVKAFARGAVLLFRTSFSPQGA